MPFPPITNKLEYRIVDIKYDNGLFDKLADATYVLTMENSDRYNNFMEQLNNFSPTKNVHIQFNKGLKNKTLIKKTTYNDLNDAYYHVLIDAKNKKYDNIIIFEDDFHFTNDIKNKKDQVHQNLKNKSLDIEKFINNNYFDFYNLGPIISFRLPVSFKLKNYYAFISIAAHGYIYSKLGREKLILDYQNKKIKYHWDSNLCKFWKYRTYEIGYPIVYQKFPITENSKTWPKIFQIMRNLSDLKKKKSVNDWILIHRLSSIISIIIILVPFLACYILYLHKI